VLDQRGQLLLAALRLRRVLDALVRPRDLQLTRYDEKGWRATLFEAHHRKPDES